MPDPKSPPRVEEPQAAYDPVAAGVRATRQLEQSGFGNRQAEAVVLAVRELAGDLVTKKDLAIAKSELRAEIAGLRAELKSELKSEISGLRAELKSELKSEISGLRAEFKTDLAQTEIRMNKNAFRNTMWTVGILAAFMLTTVGIATTLILTALPPS